jgi:uncharacterized protein (DUF305 family)
VNRSSTYHAYRRAAFIGTLLVTATALGASVSTDPVHSSFTAENDAAMAKMMAAMHITPSADVDRDFAVMMIAHHQGAIDMARAQLRFGRDPALRRIAQEIVIEQTQEIAAMHLVLRQRAHRSDREERS